MVRVEEPVPAHVVADHDGVVLRKQPHYREPRLPPPRPGRSSLDPAALSALRQASPAQRRHASPSPDHQAMSRRLAGMPPGGPWSTRRVHRRCRPATGSGAGRAPSPRPGRWPAPTQRTADQRTVAMRHCPTDSLGSERPAACSDARRARTPGDDVVESAANSSIAARQSSTTRSSGRRATGWSGRGG